jgi:hypothetical protein
MLTRRMHDVAKERNMRSGVARPICKGNQEEKVAYTTRREEKAIRNARLSHQMAISVITTRDSHLVAPDDSEPGVVADSLAA